MLAPISLALDGIVRANIDDFFLKHALPLTPIESKLRLLVH